MNVTIVLDMIALYIALQQQFNNRVNKRNHVERLTTFRFTNSELPTVYSFKIKEIYKNILKYYKK